MKASPVQLLQLFFKKVSVEQDQAGVPDGISNSLTDIFTFDGVPIQTEVGKADIDLAHERGAMFLVSLRVVIDNAVVDDSPEQKFSPYKIEVLAEALILIPKGAEKLAPPEDLAIVNGASLIWSAIREQVLNISSRMPSGPVMLPTVHFHDLKGLPSAAPQPVKSSKSRKSSKKQSQA